MQPQSPRPSDRTRLLGRSSRTSRRALCAGLLGLAALVPMGSAAAAASPPALDVLQIQRLAYPGGVVPPEALAAMTSRLAPAMSPPAEQISAEALTGSPSTAVATVADGTASEPVEAGGLSAVPETAPEAEVPVTANAMRAVIAPSKVKTAGSSPMRPPAINTTRIRDLSGVYFQPGNRSSVGSGSPPPTTASETEPAGAVVATRAEGQVAGPDTAVRSVDGAEPRRQLAAAAPRLMAPPGSAGDDAKAGASQPASSLRKPAESSGIDNPGYRALPQAQWDAVINVFAPELRN